MSAPSLPLSKTSILYRIAEQGLTPDDQLKALTLQEDLRALYEGPDALPVGICIYPRVDGRKFEVVYSQDWPMPSATHVVAGETCEHPLVVDDGALYVVEDEPLGDYQVKVALPVCVSATARQGADGIWSRETRWRIPCEFGDFDHDISWTPNGLRYEAGTPQAAHRPLARGLSDLRPVARPHPQFAPTYGRRNDAESYNEWYKKHLRHHGIAMRLTLEGQRLDFLMGAALNNAITYNRFATAA